LRKISRVAVIAVMFYGTKCWVVKNQHESKVSVVEMRMLRWMCVRLDEIRLEIIALEIERVGVASVVEMVQTSPRWFV
jgi:hypothetical protein